MTGNQRETTTLNRKWVAKMIIFLAALFILGVWGTADALLIYPRRGEHHAQFALKDYLERVDASGQSLLRASVEDPAAEMQRLSATPPTDPVDTAKQQWLESLSRIHSLAALTEQNRAALAASPGATPDTVTMFSNSRQKLQDLQTQLANQNAPKPLSAYDIPLQYLFMLIGFAGSLWMVFFLFRCAATRFQYDRAEKRLFLPDGRSFVPADVEELDKRDWHKYFIYVKLAGQPGETKLDLLRYAPLEEWILEIEKLTPNYKPEEESAAAPAPDAKPAAVGPEEAADVSRA
ncbi:MAG: hypothetical protein SFZ24_13055 [Planctomycetota bacterium]|nr:hypothetical protein [Planctomycetota bacterium]